jgi:hypothetical protein
MAKTTGNAKQDASNAAREARRRRGTSLAPRLRPPRSLRRLARTACVIRTPGSGQRSKCSLVRRNADGPSPRLPLVWVTS